MLTQPTSAETLFIGRTAQGLPYAQHALAMHYLNGERITKDIREALRLFQLAVDGQCKEAQNTLGKCYLNGENLAVNLFKASSLLQAAAQQNFAPALKLLQEQHRRFMHWRKNMKQAAVVVKILIRQLCYLRLRPNKVCCRI